MVSDVFAVYVAKINCDRQETQGIAVKLCHFTGFFEESKQNRQATNWELVVDVAKQRC